MLNSKPLITTIRGRLALLTLGLLLPGILIGGLLIWDSYRQSRASFERQLAETARALALVVDRELGQAAALTKALATSPYVANGDFAAFDQQARSVTDHGKTWIILADKDGNQFVNTSRPLGTPLPSFAPDPKSWRKLQSGETVVSNLLRNRTSDQAVVTIDTPIRIGGQTRYALSYAMTSTVLSRILADQNLPPGWIGNILDTENNVVARSFRNDIVMGSRPSAPVLAEMERADEGIVESSSFEGRPTLVAFSRSPTYRWTFGVSVPRSQLLTAITSTLALAALSGIIFMLLAALLSASVARSISAPVEALARGASALGAGEPVDVPHTKIREINAVADSLRSAADTLAHRQADLRDSESRLRLAVQATGLGIWDFDAKTGVRTWSPEFRAILGLPPDAPASTELFAGRIHPEDRGWVRAEYDLFCAGKGNGQYEAEFRILRADTGEEVWVTASARLSVDENGTPIRLNGTLIDVTARRRSEQTLRESEERFRTMADSAPVLIWLSDPAGQITFANRHYERVFGRPAIELLGNGWAEIVIPEDLSTFQSAFLRAVAEQEPFRQDVRVRDAMGEIRWLRCEGAPRLSGPESKFLGYVGCNIDVTESKLAEDALERRIEERTSELARVNFQLLSQIDERERVEATLRQVQRLEAVGQLTSGVAHDFNNLLTVILGNLSFAERTVTEGPLHKRLANMRMAAERGASLVAQLLAFSRRQRLAPKAVNLNETVLGMRELLQSSMGGSVAVDIVLEDDLWPALVDPTQMELIILNLAINARDAMEVGGLLKVETSNAEITEPAARPEEPAPGDYVVVSVSDSGSGMSPEVLSRVFEPFFTTKEVGKGSGLGLSQVLGFAQQSGGGVRIETGEGKGTTVRVFLPRSKEDVAVAKTPKTARRASTTVPSILLVDDDDLVRDVTAMKLTEFGYAVQQAANGPAALLAFEEDSGFDMLILDFAMPGMNGAEVARAARKRRPNVPILFVTGYADLTALGEFASEPILHKPFSDSDLSDQIAELLKGTRQPQRAKVAPA